MKRIYAKEMTRNQMRRMMCIGVVPAIEDYGVSDSDLYEKYKDKINGKSLDQYYADLIKDGRTEG